MQNFFVFKANKTVLTGNYPSIFIMQAIYFLVEVSSNSVQSV